MPFGILEIAIVLVIILIIFGYRRLPELGRRAGEGVNDLRGSVKDMVGDKADPKTLGRSAGKGVRELREFRDAVKGEASGPAAERAAEPAAPDRPAAPAAERPPGGAGEPERPDEPEAVDGEIVGEEDRPAR